MHIQLQQIQALSTNMCTLHYTSKTSENADHWQPHNWSANMQNAQTSTKQTRSCLTQAGQPCIFNHASPLKLNRLHVCSNPGSSPATFGVELSWSVGCRCPELSRYNAAVKVAWFHIPPCSKQSLAKRIPNCMLSECSRVHGEEPRCQPVATWPTTNTNKMAWNNASTFILFVVRKLSHAYARSKFDPS